MKGFEASLGKMIMLVVCFFQCLQTFRANDLQYIRK